jgi:nicotinamide phosphoribosyltransferase
VGKKNFNLTGWQRLLDKHGGYLPISIRSIPEGSVTSCGTVLFTVENTDPEFPWLTSYVETILSHVWYPITVATLSREVKKMIDEFLEQTSDSESVLDFMLHDFGFREVSSLESARISGAAHLLNFKRTDNLAAIECAVNDYGASLENLAFSVPTIEHSITSSLGRDYEYDIVDCLLSKYPEGILSVVADTYKIFDFVNYICTPKMIQRIKSRNGVFVIRLDSLTTDKSHEVTDVSAQIRRIIERLSQVYGYTINSKGFLVLDSSIRVLWSNDLDYSKIRDVLFELLRMRISVENIATFGIGSGLLQNVNRDTLHCAFKCSAIKNSAGWHDIYKNSVGEIRSSKRGRFSVYLNEYEELYTAPKDSRLIECHDMLEEVFRDGKILKMFSFDQIRESVSI